MTRIKLHGRTLFVDAKTLEQVRKNLTQIDNRNRALRRELSEARLGPRGHRNGNYGMTRESYCSARTPEKDNRIQWQEDKKAVQNNRFENFLRRST